MQQTHFDLVVGLGLEALFLRLFLAQFLQKEGQVSVGLVCKCARRGVVVCLLFRFLFCLAFLFHGLLATHAGALVSMCPGCT